MPTKKKTKHSAQSNELEANLRALKFIEDSIKQLNEAAREIKKKVKSLNKAKSLKKQSRKAKKA